MTNEQLRKEKKIVHKISLIRTGDIFSVTTFAAISNVSNKHSWALKKKLCKAQAQIPQPNIGKAISRPTFHF